MQRHFNIFVPLACPHCRTELLLTLDQVHEEKSICCALCGTTIVLRPEDLPVPAHQTPEPSEFLPA
ncbi:MAG: hypothetical protein AMK72_10175 [Planctomycetes bacterium SM23_25]|nr:MAG: hypothetical protein AMS14_03665 [Planctomycetes bacterium DG_20]KPK46133.1 MAG: hypothetical protein AMK72_10175 [Planctomycetes bacterium SM23_25]